MVPPGVKPAKRALGRCSPIPTRLAFSAGLRARTSAEGTRPTGFEAVTFGFVDRRPCSWKPLDQAKFGAATALARQPVRRPGSSAGHGCHGGLGTSPFARIPLRRTELALTACFTRERSLVRNQPRPLAVCNCNRERDRRVIRGARRRGQESTGKGARTRETFGGRTTAPGRAAPLSRWAPCATVPRGPDQALVNPRRGGQQCSPHAN